MPKSNSANVSAGEQFGAARRLQKRVQFLDVQKRGRKAETASFLLFWRRSLVPDAPSRLGITVTRKVGNSVVRNRIRRRAREIFRRYNSMIPTGFDYVWVAKPSASVQTFAQLLAEFEGLWKSKRGA